jgi:hypothetical protein
VLVRSLDERRRLRSSIVLYRSKVPQAGPPITETGTQILKALCEQCCICICNVAMPCHCRSTTALASVVTTAVGGWCVALANPQVGCYYSDSGDDARHWRLNCSSAAVTAAVHSRRWVYRDTLSSIRGRHGCHPSSPSLVRSLSGGSLGAHCRNSEKIRCCFSSRSQH